MSALSSAPLVKDALGLSDEQTTLEGTIGFIEFILEQERLGKQYSRVILDEIGNLIGVITLKDIDNINKTSHIGTWIGHHYWGKGYNLLAKREILYRAFTEMKLDMEGLFDVIITGDDVIKPKPDPEGLLKALSLLKVENSDAIYIGDSDADIIAGVQANVYTIGVQ